MAPAHSRNPWLAAAFIQPLCRDHRVLVFISLAKYTKPIAPVQIRADPENPKERWLNSYAAKFWLMNYSLGCVNLFVSIYMLLQLSVFYHHHEENEAGYAVWLSCSKYLSV